MKTRRTSAFSWPLLTFLSAVSKPQAATSCVCSLSEQELAMTLYSTALYSSAARGRGCTGLDLLAMACAKQLGSVERQRKLKPQGTANTLWALARLPCLGEQQLQVGRSAAQALLEDKRKLQSFQPMELSASLRLRSLLEAYNGNEMVP